MCAQYHRYCTSKDSILKVMAALHPSSNAGTIYWQVGQNVAIYTTKSIKFLLNFWLFLENSVSSQAEMCTTSALRPYL